MGPELTAELQGSSPAIHLAHTRHDQPLCEQQWTKCELQDIGLHFNEFLFMSWVTTIQ